MRIRSVTVENVGGVVDQTIELPNEPVVALAGPNGTGKSKTLAAIVSLWSHHLPAPAGKEEATAEIVVDLSPDERRALTNFHKQLWGELAEELPANVRLRTKRSELRGTTREATPAVPGLSEFTAHEVVLRDNRSLDIMYLPAERRLMPSTQSGIDLQQLADAISFQKSAESRAAVQNYGRLDDAEFEQFAKALCMADRLDNDPTLAPGQALSRVSWDDFLQTVNELIYPKKLLPLYRQTSDQLFIQLPNGDKHSVPDLSSGERQALVIISRVLRAGAGHSVVVIDEPDAYLHPNLSHRLLSALRSGVGPDGQLIIATHSPAILDQLPPQCIIRLDHAKKAQALADTNAIINLHRDTGFRASTLTQSDLLIVTEGELDETVLKELLPATAGSASFSQGNGRAGVISRVKSLDEYKVPTLGIVDRDVSPPSLSADVVNKICILPTADIEGAFLSDDVALQIMLDIGAVREEFKDIELIRRVVNELYNGMRDNTIAEFAKNALRERLSVKWPNARSANPLDTLRSASIAIAAPDPQTVENIITDATAQWDRHAAAPWEVVRGKYILGDFTSRISHYKSGDALLKAVAQQQPRLAALTEFEARLDLLLRK